MNKAINFLTSSCQGLEIGMKGCVGETGNKNHTSSYNIVNMATSNEDVA